MKHKLLRFWKPLLAVIFWGASFVATKIALGELSPLSVILLRTFLGIIFISGFALYTKRDFKISFENMKRIFVLALILICHLLIQVTGIKYTTATNTGWIVGVTPVFMALLGFIFFKEKLSPMKISGIVIAFAGLVLLISNGNFLSIGLLSHKGDFLVLISAFTWGIYSMVNKKISISYSPVMTILFLFIMLEILLLPFAINHDSIYSAAHLSAKGWAAILFLGIFSSGTSFVLWSKSLSELEATKAGAFLYLEPFVTVFAAWIFLSELITFITIASGLIITAGVILVNRE